MSAASTSTSCSAICALLANGRTSRSSSPRPPWTPSASPATSTGPPRQARAGDRSLRPPLSPIECAAARPGRARPPGGRRRAPTPGSGISDLRLVDRSTKPGSGPATCWCSCPASAEIREAPRPAQGCTTTAWHRGAAAVARQSAQGAGRCFAVQGPAVVLATNVAETSLTVPASAMWSIPACRVKRYPPQQGPEQLQVEKIAQSAAASGKRAARRVDGICIRLYDEDDFQSARPTPIRRSCAPPWPA